MTDDSNIPEPTDHTYRTGIQISSLNRGLIALNIQREMEESAYYAMDRMTKNHKVVSRRQEYCADIERVLVETNITIQLLSRVTDDADSQDGNYLPEEIISYYEGVFLDQVHQIKDKIFRLIDRLLLDIEAAQDNQKNDPKKITYSTFMSKHEDELRKIGIFDALSEWGSGNLQLALQKRTNHHHFVSTLRLNQDFQKIKMSRLMLNPSSIDSLSEYGKQHMIQFLRKYFKKWRDEKVSKLAAIFEEIQTNVEKIAESLIDYYSIPTSNEDVAKIMSSYLNFLESFDIQNQTSKEKIQDEIRSLISESVELAKQLFGDNLFSVYLAGSAARGEFLMGRSDINLYLILNEEGNEKIVFDKHPLLQVNVFTKTAFKSPTHKKDRFICWSDGLLLHGEGIEFDKKEFPKPGTLLCLLLNRGVIERLEQIKLELDKLKKPSRDTLLRYTLKIVKVVMDFDFGVAMSNKPYYTASRQGKIDYTRQTWPNERRTTTLEQIYKEGVVKKEDLIMLIDVFIEKARPNYQKLVDIEAEIVNGAVSK